MKKIILMFLLGSITTLIFASSAYKTKAVTVKINNSSYSDWSVISGNNFCIIDQDEKTIYISTDIDYNVSDYTFKILYSKGQSFNYSDVNIIYDYNQTLGFYRLETISAYDSNNNKCNIWFYIYDSGQLFLYIEYNNVKYQYKLLKY